MLRKLATPGRLLAIILCVAAVLRFYGIEWDSRAGQHPDERHVTNTIGRLTLPTSWGEYFSESASPLNPRNYEGGHFWAYGTLPTTVLRGVIGLGGITKPEHSLLFGRGLSALADLGVVLLLFLLARNLYGDRRIALFAAALYALAVLPIQEAHFFVVDPMANLFTMLAMWLLARAWRSGRWFDYAWVGIAIGLAFSCKISAAAFGLPMGLVALLPAAGQPHARPLPTIRTAALRCAVFLVAAFLTVHVAMPDAFAGFFTLAPRWIKNMREVVAISTGQVDIPYTRQWVNRLPLIWPWWNLVVWGLGLPLGLTAWLAWLGATWQLLVRRAWEHLIPVSWIATVFISQGLIYQATLRYFLPIYGALIMLAAWMLVRGVDRARAAETPDRPRRWLRFAALAAPLVVAAGTLIWALGFVSIYRQPHTRVEASRWMYEHIPPGSIIACEDWDDWLPLPLPGSPGPGVYRQIKMPLYLVDDGDKRGALLALLNQAEYIVIASQKLTDSIPRMPHRYPFTISYYEGLRDGSLGFDKVAEFTRSMNVLGFPVSTRSGGRGVQRLRSSAGHDLQEIAALRSGGARGSLQQHPAGRCQRHALSGEVGRGARAPGAARENRADGSGRPAAGGALGAGSAARHLAGDVRSRKFRGAAFDPGVERASAAPADARTRPGVAAFPPAARSRRGAGAAVCDPFSASGPSGCWRAPASRPLRAGTTGWSCFASRCWRRGAYFDIARNGAAGCATTGARSGFPKSFSGWPSPDSSRCAPSIRICGTRPGAARSRWR